jgi:hypothetical protein
MVAEEEAVGKGLECERVFRTRDHFLVGRCPESQNQIIVGPKAVVAAGGATAGWLAFGAVRSGAHRAWNWGGQDVLCGQADAAVCKPN